MVLKISTTQKPHKKSQKMTPKKNQKMTLKKTQKMILRKTQKMTLKKTPRKSQKKRKGRERHTIAAAGTRGFPVASTAIGAAFLKKIVPVSATEAGFPHQVLRLKRSWRSKKIARNTAVLGITEILAQNLRPPGAMRKRTGVRAIVTASGYPRRPKPLIHNKNSIFLLGMGGKGKFSIS